MRAPHSGERTLTELDFQRLHNFTAAATVSLLASLVDEADVVLRDTAEAAHVDA